MPSRWRHQSRVPPPSSIHFIICQWKTQPTVETELWSDHGPNGQILTSSQPAQKGKQSSETRSSEDLLLSLPSVSASLHSRSIASVAGASAGPLGVAHRTVLAPVHISALPGSILTVNSPSFSNTDLKATPASMPLNCSLVFTKSPGSLILHLRPFLSWPQTIFLAFLQQTHPHLLALHCHPLLYLIRF